MVSQSRRSRSTGHAISLRFIPSQPLQALIHGASTEAAKRRSKGAKKCR